jgi:hypothetical protein
MTAYSLAVQADVRKRMSPPNRQDVPQISQELGIHRSTLYLINQLDPQAPCLACTVVHSY